jgi:hypothetical protein
MKRFIWEGSAAGNTAVVTAVVVAVEALPGKVFVGSLEWHGNL